VPINAPLSRVLIVDDDERERSVLAEMVTQLGFVATTAADGREALDLHAESPFDVILTDLTMPKMDGAELLRTLEASGDRTPIIVMTGYGSIEKAISVVHDLKAFWFVEKPVQPGMLRVLLERATAHHKLVEETAHLNRQLIHHGVLGDLVGGSDEMRRVYSLINQVAPTSASVLITGESGTGKELVARALHRLSSRSAGPFMAINCAALTETLIESELFGHEKGAFTGAVERHFGCFEQANRGTVFLDEIGDMPIGTQAKLLRVLEDRKVRRLGGKNDLPIDVRIISATNRPPEEAIKSKLLREDLYYRLNVFQLSLPPLRDRKDDILPISEAVIANLNAKHGCRVAGLHPAVIEKFLQYAWPGNVRELRNVLERAVIIASEGMIQVRHVSMESFNGPRAGSVESRASSPAEAPEVSDNQHGTALHIRPGAPLEEVERAYIEVVLRATGNNKMKAAEILGISARTLYNRLGQKTESAATATKGATV
jgi:DNA-binding NtrC family response regulator